MCLSQGADAVLLPAARPSQSLEGLIPSPRGCVCIPNNQQTGLLWTLSAKEGKLKQYLKLVNPLTLREGALLEIKAFLLPVINAVCQQAQHLKDPTKLELAWLFPKKGAYSPNSRMPFSLQLSTTQRHLLFLAGSSAPWGMGSLCPTRTVKIRAHSLAQPNWWGAWVFTLGCVHTNWAVTPRVSLPPFFFRHEITQTY